MTPQEERKERRAKREAEKKRLGLGFKKRRGLSPERARRHERTGICLSCHKISSECECAGIMTEKAMDRFFEKQKIRDN